MPTPKRRRSIAFKPKSEALEGRQLLSAQVISGIDIDGDAYVLRLVGPGSISVVNQPGPDGRPTPLTEPGLIQQITVAGTVAGSSMLFGQVTPAPGGDGKVFFENLIQLPATTPLLPGASTGMMLVDMPDFWLGDTSPGQAQPGNVQGRISFPEGVITLRFGGVDTTAFFGTDPSQRLDQNNQSDRFEILLGQPQFAGTSMIVDQIITTNQPPVTPEASPTFNTVNITTLGRVNLFQANAILGDPTLGEGPFEGDNLGGTILNAMAVGVTDPGLLAVGPTGQIGRFRVGGDATNVTVQVSGGPPTGGGFDRITNFSIGGETNKVTVVAPGGLRNAEFGRGMDTVSIVTDIIESLSANRGAINSTITTQREARRLTFGGDVINSRILSGYLVVPEFAVRSGGDMTVLVAGDVLDTVFAASVEIGDELFGSPTNLELAHGLINAKVEGFIDNSLNPEVDPGAIDRAFFARNVRLERGPVTPPAVMEPPFIPQPGPGRTPGVLGLSGGPGINRPRRVARFPIRAQG